MKLDNRVAIVTGASRGIGRCIAVYLAQEGVHLALVARNEKDLCATAFTCEQYGVTAKIYPYDLTDIEGIPHLVSTIKRDFRHIDILVNDAGKYEEADPLEKNLDGWDKTLDLNFKSVYHLTTEVIRTFSEKETAIVNISSISGLTVTGGGEIYNASKAAIKSYGGCLFEDLRENGTKVINIYPGYVNTSMTKDEAELDHAKMIQPQDVATTVLWALQTPSNTCPTDITLRPQYSPSKKAA